MLVISAYFNSAPVLETIPDLSYLAAKGCANHSHESIYMCTFSFTIHRYIVTSESVITDKIVAQGSFKPRRRNADNTNLVSHLGYRLRNKML